MRSAKDTTRAFIVRIWVEPREIMDAEPKWRGVIEQVEDGKRVYFDRLDKMRSYFDEYLREIGIRTDDQLG